MGTGLKASASTQPYFSHKKFLQRGFVQPSMIFPVTPASDEGPLFVVATFYSILVWKNVHGRLRWMHKTSATRRNFPLTNSESFCTCILDPALRDFLKLSIVTYAEQNHFRKLSAFPSTDNKVRKCMPRITDQGSRKIRFQTQTSRCFPAFPPEGRSIQFRKHFLLSILPDARSKNQVILSFTV